MLVFENDFGLALFTQKMMPIMSLNYHANQLGFLSEFSYKFRYQDTSLIHIPFICGTVVV